MWGWGPPPRPTPAIWFTPPPPPPTPHPLGPPSHDQCDALITLLGYVRWRPPEHPPETPQNLPFRLPPSPYVPQCLPYRRLLSVVVPESSLPHASLATAHNRSNFTLNVGWPASPRWGDRTYHLFCAWGCKLSVTHSIHMCSDTHAPATACALRPTPHTHTHAHTLTHNHSHPRPPTQTRGRTHNCLPSHTRTRTSCTRAFRSLIAFGSHGYS